MATVTAPRRPAAPQIHQTQLFIDGQWVPAKSGKVRFVAELSYCMPLVKQLFRELP